MLVVLNPAAGGGTALARWEAIVPELRAAAGTFRTVAANDCQEAHASIASALEAGETVFVAAGGDGTVNLVLACLVELAGDGLPRLTLGAVGLGSSNDFHKPIRPHRRIGPIPCRLGASDARPHDVGLLAWSSEDGHLRWQPWIVNASIGITAEANRFYNERSGLMERVKRRGTGVAMTWAALHGLFRAGVTELTVENGSGSARRFRVRNLGIVKNPHFAGRLRYDSPHDPTSGDFFVHILGDVGLRRAVTTLAGLARGRFVGRSGTRSWRASRLTVSGSAPFAVEMDGEVITTRSAEFSILPQRIRVCG